MTRDRVRLQKRASCRHLRGIRTLVALGWVAAGFLFDLGVSFDLVEVQLLAKLGGS